MNFLTYVKRILKFEQIRHLMLGFMVHAIFLISVFDIYFQSPIVNDISLILNDVDPPAKRIVIFVGDGVRFDKFFEINNNATESFLRGVIERKGRWGISRTRVPTESRPGHVAIVAGFYEDPSAIFKGWKDNPVGFDTIFNQSSRSFGWGSPDILLMFNKDASMDKVFMHTYSSNIEIFFAKENVALKQSLWSYEKFRDTINEGRNNSSLRAILMENRLIYFLHLLGTDTSGHSDKPASREYLENIRITDLIVRNTVHLVNEFYQDNMTAFIYTSDHGMTDWGSHGDGSLAETETPFVAWGAGVSLPQSSSPEQIDVRDVNLEPLTLVRNDLEQIDIPSLVSVLIGIPIPVHSTGILPIDYLNMDDTNKNKALYLNARQLHAQYIRKRQLIEQNVVSWLYTPFDDTRLREIKRSVHEQTSRDDTKAQRANLTNEILLLIDCIRSGISYYQNYYQRPLLISISLAYFGWIIRLTLYLVEPKDTTFFGMPSSSRKVRRRLIMLSNGIGTSLFLIIIGLLNIQKLPLQYYVYFCLPLVIWWNAVRSFLNWYYCNRRICQVPEIFKLVTHLCVYTLAAESLVFVFFERRLLTVIMLASTAYQILRKPVKSILVTCVWIISSIIICTFPLLPVIGAKPDNIYLMTCAVGWTIVFGILRRYFAKETRTLYVSFILLELTVCFVIYLTSIYLRKEEISTIYRSCSWTLLFMLPLVPVCCRSRQKILPSMLYSLFSYGNIMILFSVAHESLFMPCFTIHLVAWFIIEYDSIQLNNIKPILKMTVNSEDNKYQPESEHNLQFDYIRKAYLFFLYIVYSFFATGNMASINSFDISAVRCFISTFSPFTMTALLIVKIVIPFVAVTTVFKAINIVSGVSAQKMFVMVLIFCSIMGLNFLFFVKNVGSWLEIGSSVSHYVIAQATTLCLLLIYSLTSITYRTVIRNYATKYTD